MTWFGKTFRSISVSGSSAIRFLGDGNKNPEAKHFHEMIRDLDKKNQNPNLDPCIDYFIEHFGSLEYQDLDALRLHRETTFLLIQFIPIFAENLPKINKPDENKTQIEHTINHGFLFIEKAIFIFLADQKNLSIIYNFIFTIMETNNTYVLSRAIAFVSKCLSIPILAAAFYCQGDALTNLWLICYVNNPVTCQFYGPLFSATAQGTPFNMKNQDVYKPFFTQVNESFRDLKFQLSLPQKSKEPTQVEENKIADNIGNIQTAINFIAVVCSKVNSGNFFSEFFLVTKLYFLNLPSLNVFHTFLASKTTNPSAPWDCINEICKSEFCSIALLESALEVLYEFRDSLLISTFSFHPFIDKAKELSYDSQTLLFGIIDKLPLTTKLDFFNFSLPPWDTGINTQLLCEKLVLKNPWAPYSSEMLSTLVLKSEYSVFRDNLIQDKYISQIITTLIDMISNDEEISIVLYNLFIRLSNENIKAAVHCIRKIANNQNVILYLQPFLCALREKIVCDSVFDIYSKLARKSLFFVLSFLENDGVPALFVSLKSDASLNFLSALSSNGPYDQIDNYINENFEKTELANLPSIKLKKLMMAVNQDSKFQGLLRIPSLAKYIKSEDIILSTQFDRFIFGINAAKYGVNTKDNLMKSSPTYMNSKNVENLCMDPEMLLHITSPNYPHFSVFQCHHDAPHCTATFKLEITTTFWIYILSIFDRTILMSTSFGEICLLKKPSPNSQLKNNINDGYLENGFIEISFFGLDPVPIELKKWNMITLTATDFTFQSQQIVVYLNTTKIGEINGTVGSTVTFGSDILNRAIYYLSSSFQTFESVVTPNEINQMYSNGPQVFCPTSIKMKPGFIYVPYKGIAKYLDRLGGPEFIFIMMRRVDNYDDLIKLIQSAFNMLYLGLIKKPFFFSSLRYILNYKFELINAKEKNWHPNFELILYQMLDFDVDKKYEYSMRIFTDYTLLSLNYESFKFDILPSIFQNAQSEPQLLNQLFHFLIDSYIVFDLPKLMVDNIIKSINIYLDSNNQILDMLLLVISAAAFVESNEGTMLSLNDDKIYHKQVTLFQIIVDHMDKLTQQIKFEHSLIYISTLRDELALDLLQLIAKISIITPSYFDLEVFRRYLPYMILVSKYEMFWKALLIFYTSQSADSIEDFADISIARPEMTDIVLELLPYYIRYEISNCIENPISFSVVKVVIKLMIQADISFADYIDQIQKLACLGFDQEKPSASQFTFDITNELTQPKTPSTTENVVPPKLIQKLAPMKLLFKTAEFTTLTRIQSLDPLLFDDTCNYLSKFNNTITNMLNNILTSIYSEKDNIDANWKHLEFERLPVPENIENYCKSEAVQIIANLVATLFIQRANASGISNKLLVKLLINACDANSTVVQIMHRKIVYAIFASPKPLTDDNYELFVKFIIARVYEGWWYNDDFFLLFQASFIRKTKSTKQLIMACIIQNTNYESQIRIMKELCISNEFFDYLVEPSFFSCFVQLIGRYEIVNNSTFPEFKKELIETLKPYLSARYSKYKEGNENENGENEQLNAEIESDPISKLYEALINTNPDYLIDWINQFNLDDSHQAAFNKAVNEMKKDIASNSKIIRDLRYEITIPPTYHLLIKQQASRIGNALYIRRAFRYQFFLRFNKSNIEVETSISSIFQKEIRLKFNKNPSDKTMIVPAPHPFVVPQKFDPLCYDFPIPQGKFSKKSLNEKCEAHLHLNQGDLSHCSNGVIFPQSMHYHKYPTVLPELTDLKNQNAPKCYEGWQLPSFVFDAIPLDSLLLNYFEATSPLFDCSILMNPELLPGVAAFNNESFSIVLNARLRNYNIFINNTKNTTDDNGFGFTLYTSNVFTMQSSPFDKLLQTNQTTIPLSSLLNDNAFTGQLILQKSSEMLSHFAIIENAAHGIYGSSKMFMHHPVISFKYKDVLIAIPRRFVYQNQMVDIYFINGLHLTLIMKESDRKLLLQNIKQVQQMTTLSQIYFRSLASSNQLLSSTGPYFAISLLAKSIDKVTKMWQGSELSTLDYLLYLNVLGGRSFNDLSQYPVFPWILGDFNEDTPVLKRDLTKPMGTQTTARESRFISTYNETEPHCHYRTHYSHPAAVLHYMLRCEPFTFFNLHLHSGLDHRDRQFSSINDAWRSASEANLSDLKELIPEFYTLPSMFENPNHVDFQCRSDGISLGTVVLPSWAENNAEKFIWDMRTALECPETSSKIGNWIDLIFGYKQRGQAAIDAINVFQPLAYDTAITTIINESSNNSLFKQDTPDPNIDITMNYALSNSNANSNFIETISKDDSHADSSSYTIDVNAYKEYLLLIEQRKALTDAILQFGECPSQLFTTTHPECEDRAQFFTRMTIANSKTIVTKLSQFSPNSTSIQFTREKDELLPHVLPDFEHYVGNASPKLIKAWDGYIEFDTNHPIRIDSTDSCSTSCISPDRLILAIASRLGVIIVLACVNTTINAANKVPLHKVNNIMCSSFNVTAMAISTQHALLVAVSSKHIQLFDYTTGFLIKKIDTSINKSNQAQNTSSDDDELFGNAIENTVNDNFEKITRVVFDDISNFIVTISQSYLTIYGLDLRLIARTENSNSIPPFSSIATSQTPFWYQMPLYVTGHTDGSVYAWRVNILQNEFYPVQILSKKQTNRTAITAISLFMNDRAVLAIDAQGKSFLATIFPFNQALHSTVNQIQQNLSNSSASSVSPDSSPSSHRHQSSTADGDDEQQSDQTKMQPTSIMTNNSPFSQLSSFSTSSYFMSPQVFDTCRICGSSIKGGIGVKCMCCCLYICKQCVASKRPVICSFCKTQFSNLQSFANESENDSSISSESDKAKTKVGSIFANAFSFRKVNTLPADSSVVEKKPSSQPEIKKAEKVHFDSDINDGKPNEIINDEDEDNDSLSKSYLRNQALRRNSLILSRVNHPIMISSKEPTDHLLNFDMHMNSNSSSNETLAAEFNNSINGTQSLKLLTHTQMNMNEDDENELTKTEKKNQKIKTKKTNPNKNDDNDFGTMTLKYREEMRHSHGRRYSLSSRFSELH